MTPVDLARFRTGCANCELAMLVDLSAGTVLIADSSVPFGQERLDQLCAHAISIFARALPASGTAILCGPDGSRVFLQSRTDPSEGLCALFGPSADLVSACAAGMDLLSGGATR